MQLHHVGILTVAKGASHQLGVDAEAAQIEGQNRLVGGGDYFRRLDVKQGVQRGAFGRGVGAGGLVGSDDHGLEFVGAGEKQVDKLPVGEHAPVAQQRHDALHDMREVGNRGEAEKTGGPFYTMNGAEQAVEQFGVLRCRFKGDQVGFERFEVLGRLLDEQPQHLVFFVTHGD